MTRRGIQVHPAWAILTLSAIVACGGESGGNSDGVSNDPTQEPPTTTPTAEPTDEFPAEMLPAELSPDLPLVAPQSELDIPVFTDIVHVNPGEDVTFCTFTDVILEEATIFGQSFGAQSPMGHHAILQYATTPQEPHTGSCGGMDSPILLGGTGGKAVADEQYLPENYGIEVPAGAQLVINHHWINTSPDPVDGQSMMLARGLPRGGDTVMAGNMIMIGFGWEIPALAEYEYTSECTFGGDVPYVLALGHMHEWGSHVRIEIDRADGTLESLIDRDWSPEMATDAGGGSNIYTLDDPFMIRTGDTVRLTCQWSNDTMEPIGFPREMCIFFGFTVGVSNFCANGGWLTAEQAAAGGMAQEIINNL